MKNKYECIHCEYECNTLDDAWKHEDKNSAHSVWIKQEAVKARN